MKNFKIVIVATVLLVLIGVGAVLSLRKITSKPKKDAINLFDEDITNETIELLDGTNSTLDNIFGDTLSSEDKALLALTNSSENDMPQTTDTLSKLDGIPSKTISNTNKIKGNTPLTDDTYTLVENEDYKPSSRTTATSDNYYSDEGDNNFPPLGDNKSFDPKKVNIKSFIIDYNKTLSASKNKPIFITLVVKTPENGKYARVRVYARKLSAKNEILSRDLIFSLPRIRVIDSQTQTQFYFAGRNTNRKQLSSGKYILYAEIEVTDKNGKSVGKTGRYPYPKWNYIITLK